MSAAPVGPRAAGWTRVSAVGSVRRCELSVPDDQPLGDLLPRMVELLAEPHPEPRALWRLVDAVGTPLPLDHGLVDVGLTDGAVVRLVAQAEEPQPPLLADLTDTVAAARAPGAEPWTDGCRSRVVPLALAVAGTALSAAAPEPAVVLAALGLLGLLTALWTTHRGGDAALVRAVVGASLGAALVTGLHAGLGLAAPLAGDLPVVRLFPAYTVTLVCGWVVVAVVLLGAGRLAPLAGAGVAVATVAVPWLSTALLDGDQVPERAAALGVAAAAVVHGLVPQLACLGSGLTALDAAAGGTPVLRSDVERRTVLAHDLTTWMVAGVGSGTALAAGVLLASDRPWAVATGGAAVLGLALRARAHLLLAAHLAAWLTVGLALTGGWLGQPVLAAGGSAAAAAGPAVLATLLVLSLRTPSPPARARLRRLGDRAQIAVAVALPTLLLGLFGVFGALVERA